MITIYNLHVITIIYMYLQIIAIKGTLIDLTLFLCVLLNFSNSMHL